MFLPSARTELNSRFIVMTMDEVTLNRPEVGTGFSVICGFCRLRLSLRVLSEHLLSKFPPRLTHSQERFLVILSCQIDEFLLDLSVKSDGYFQAVLRRYHKRFEWFSKSSLIPSSPISQEVSDISQIAVALHRVRPPPVIQSRL